MSTMSGTVIERLNRNTRVSIVSKSDESGSRTWRASWSGIRGTGAA